MSSAFSKETFYNFLKDPNNDRYSLKIESPNGIELVKKVTHVPNIETYYKMYLDSGNYNFLNVKFYRKMGSSRVIEHQEKVYAKHPQNTQTKMFEPQQPQQPQFGMNGADTMGIYKMVNHDDIKRELADYKSKYETLVKEHADLKLKHAILEMQASNKPIIAPEIISGIVESLPSLLAAKTGQGMNKPTSQLSEIKQNAIAQITAIQDPIVKELMMIKTAMYEKPKFLKDLRQLYTTHQLTKTNETTN